MHLESWDDESFFGKELALPASPRPNWTSYPYSGYHNFGGLGSPAQWDLPNTFFGHSATIPNYPPSRNERYPNFGGLESPAPPQWNLPNTSFGHSTTVPIYSSSPNERIEPGGWVSQPPLQLNFPNTTFGHNSSYVQFDNSNSPTQRIIEQGGWVSQPPLELNLPNTTFGHSSSYVQIDNSNSPTQRIIEQGGWVSQPPLELNLPNTTFGHSRGNIQVDNSNSPKESTWVDGNWQIFANTRESNSSEGSMLETYEAFDQNNNWADETSRAISSIQEPIMTQEYLPQQNYEVGNTDTWIDECQQAILSIQEPNMSEELVEEPNEEIIQNYHWTDEPSQVLNTFEPNMMKQSMRQQNNDVVQNEIRADDGSPEVSSTNVNDEPTIQETMEYLNARDWSNEALEEVARMIPNKEAESILPQTVDVVQTEVIDDSCTIEPKEKKLKFNLKPGQKKTWTQRTVFDCPECDFTSFFKEAQNEHKRNVHPIKKQVQKPQEQTDSATDEASDSTNAENPNQKRSKLVTFPLGYQVALNKKGHFASIPIKPAKDPHSSYAYYLPNDLSVPLNPEVEPVHRVKPLWSTKPIIQSNPRLPETTVRNGAQDKVGSTPVILPGKKVAVIQRVNTGSSVSNGGVRRPMETMRTPMQVINKPINIINQVIYKPTQIDNSFPQTINKPMQIIKNPVQIMKKPIQKTIRIAHIQQMTNEGGRINFKFIVPVHKNLRIHQIDMIEPPTKRMKF